MRYKKHFTSLFFVLLLFLPLISASALTENTAYQAMVKIFTYAEEENDYLGLEKVGTGAINDANGHILTDYDLATINTGTSSEKEVAFKVCLTVSLSGEPNCGFSAELVGKNEARGVAVLKIKNIEGLTNQTSFLSLKREKFDNVRIGESVRSIEFPADSNILSFLRAYIIDSKEEHDLSWIRVEPDFSTNSSGAIIVNKDADILGMTSAMHDNSLGQDGYLINLPPHNTWIDSIINTSPQESSLQERMESLIIAQNDLGSKDIFTNELPMITLTKNSGWEFTYEQENEISVTDPEDAYSGSLFVSWRATDDLVANELDQYGHDLEVVGYSLVGDEEVAGLTGKKYTLDSTDPINYQTLLPLVNYLITLNYNYGQAEASQSVIDSMINALVISDQGIEFTPPAEEAATTTEETAITTEEEVTEEPAEEEEKTTEEPAESVLELVVKDLTTDLGRKLIGKILLQVELNGEAWYLNPLDEKAYFLGRPADAFKVMREQGVGITNQDLEKITIGSTAEVLVKEDNAFVEQHAGKIFLQVEENGEAWYIYPLDNKRYYLGRPADAFNIMRSLGLGISEANFSSL